jgi:hypothetical protein
MISRSLRLFLLLAIFFAWTPPAAAQQQPQAVSPGESTYTIVLPPKLIAGKAATLAVIGADGHLAPGVGVDISGGQRLLTDATGRALFTAPGAPGVLLAKISGQFSAATVILPEPPAGKAALSGVPPIISSRDRFTLLGAGFQGEADANHVEVGDQPALVLAASPVALVVLTAPRITPGQKSLSVRTDAGTSSTTTTLVELSLETGGRAITAHEKTKVIVRVLGSEQSLAVEARSLAPEVVRILGENPQRVQTSGGPENTASIDIEGVQAGEFGFRVRLISPPAGSPDVEAAQKYLEAAARVAPEGERRKVQKCLSRLQKPKDASKVRAEIDKMLAGSSGDFTLLLDSARKSLLTP